MPAGRPPTYEDGFSKTASQLAKLGATDQEIADFLDINPSRNDVLEYSLLLRREDRFGVIAARKKIRADGKRRRRASSPSRRLVDATRARIWASLKGRTDGALFSRLEYSLDNLKKHLEGLFREGMTWENYGRWHVDHIKPCASFDLTDPEQFSECWALKNLQPLWSQENCRKGARYDPA